MSDAPNDYAHQYIAAVGGAVRYSRDAFAAARAANPLDPTTAGAFADYLDEQGDHAHAEIVRSELTQPARAGTGPVWADVRVGGSTEYDAAMTATGYYSVRSGHPDHPDHVHVQWSQKAPDGRWSNWGGLVTAERALALGRRLFRDADGLATDDSMEWEYGVRGAVAAQKNRGRRRGRR